eukprot:7142032-Prymnesium_polylepis.1
MRNGGSSRGDRERRSRGRLGGVWDLPGGSTSSAATECRRVRHGSRSSRATHRSQSSLHRRRSDPPVVAFCSSQDV